MSLRCLTLALSGEAAVASAKPAGNRIGGHHSEPASGLVRFNAGLGLRGAIHASGLSRCSSLGLVKKGVNHCSAACAAKKPAPEVDRVVDEDRWECEQERTQE